MEEREQRVLDQAADFERRFHISADDENNSRRDSLISTGPVCINLVYLFIPKSLKHILKFSPLILTLLKILKSQNFNAIFVTMGNLM